MPTTADEFGGPPDGGSHVTLVGVGASAGGLAALKSLLRHTPSDQGIAYVLVQHLDPTHQSVMAELLDKHTEMPVREIEGDEAIEANHVYVIPPDKYVVVEDGTLRLKTPQDERGRRMAVDALFKSLASQMGRRAIGVVLTGTGSDGTVGLKEIRAAGGLALVQDPDEAEHAGMPHSAVIQHAVDRVLPIEEIAETILGYAEHPYSRQRSPSDDGGDYSSGRRQIDVAQEIKNGEEQDLREALELVHEELGIDLSGYRSATILRRLHRRMGLNQIHSLSAYVDRLREDQTELEELASEMHINVTDFFRDPQAFQLLEEKVAPRLFAHAEEKTGDERVVRVWIPGCATGEEAYSIAITLIEGQEQQHASRPVKLQIFATDVDKEAVRIARAGVFPESAMSGVSPARRARFFDALDEPGTFRVKSTLRDMITFASHDVLSDPPFSRLDLISCRNLLIYLEKEAKEATLQLFHFSTRPQGFLFLGPSESLGDQSDAFRTVSKRWRIFQRLDYGKSPRRPLRNFSSARIRQEMEVGVQRREDRERRQEEVDCLIAQAAAPPSVLINQSLHVVHLHGDLIEYLELPKGGGDLNFLDMLREDLRTRVQAAVYRAAREMERVQGRGRMMTRAGDEMVYEVTVRPVESESLGDGLLLVTFERQPMEEAEHAPSNGDTVNAELERELAATREDLQATVAELENANQELRSSGEEAMTMNEELQSSNEELETQYEELRSVNEELSTLNAQLRDKIEEAQQAQTDLANVTTSARFAAIFLGRDDYQIRRYTPEAADLLGLKDSDVGQTLRYFTSRAAAEGLLEDAEQVMNELAPVEREVYDEGGACHLRVVLPYRTQEDRIDGVVVTFTDVTRLRQLARELDRQRVHQEAVSRIGMRAVSEDDFPTLCQYAVQVVAETVDAPKVHVLQLQPDRTGALEVASVGWDGDPDPERFSPLPPDSFGAYVAETAGPVAIDSLNKEPRFAESELVAEEHVESAAGIEIPPLVGKPVALLAVYSEEPQAFDVADQAFLQQVATVLSNSLQRRRAEEELRKSEERFRTLADNISQLAWMADEKGWIFWYNRRWYEYTGTSLETMRGWGWKSVQHPDHLDRVVAKWKAAHATGEPWEDIFPLRSKDGEYRWFLSRAVPIRDDNGEIVRWFGTNTDITAQRRAEQAAQRTRDRLQAIIDNAPAAIYAKDREGRFILSNRTHAMIIQATPDEVLGQTDADFDVSASDRHDYAANDARVWATGEPIEVEERLPTEDGDRMFISLKFPLRTEEGEMYAVCGVSTDITERNAAAEHLKLVMAELNHRVKNILAVVEAVADRTGDVSESIDDFRTSFAERLRSLAAAHSLLTKTEWQGSTLSDMLTTELQPRAGSDGQLTFEGPDVTLLPRESIALHMVVHELATNAAKYGALATAAGRLTVKWSLEEDAESKSLHIIWSETGGSPPAAPGRGGYGVPMMKRVIEDELGGRIKSEFGEHGFSCRISTPVAGVIPPNRLERILANFGEFDGASPVVLLVEDRVLLAERVRDELKSAGFAVVGPVTTVSEALKLLERRSVDMALLDVDLNGEMVYPVAEELGRREVPFAFLTGFTSADLDDRFADRPILEKPVNMKRLLLWLEDTRRTS